MKRTFARLSVSHIIIEVYFYVAMDLVMTGRRNLKKIIILHDSYLPEYKGWAPTVNYLINGSKYLGVTAFQATNVVDTGGIYQQLRKKISYPNANLS